MARVTWRTRLLTVLLAVMMLTPLLPGPATAGGQPRAFVIDGLQWEDPLPMDEAGRVPLRFLTDAVGGVQIDWIAAARAAQVLRRSPRGDKRFQVRDGSAYIQGPNRMMSAAAVMKDGRLWVPLADVAEALGYTVAVEPEAVRLTSDRTVHVAIFPWRQTTEKPPQISAVLDEYYWTVVSGQMDPALRLVFLTLSSAYTADVSVPLDAEGHFTARLRLEPGKATTLTLSGRTAESQFYLFSGSVSIVPPTGPGPTLPPGESLTVVAESLRPGVVDVQAATDDTSQLLLTITPQVRADAVQVWLFGLTKTGGNAYMLPVLDGVAKAAIPLPGPAAYELTVNVPNEQGFAFTAAVSLHLVQHGKVARDDGGINTKLLPRLDDLPNGDFTDFVPISGSTVEAGDGFILAYVAAKTGPGDRWLDTNSISAVQKIPVVDGHFAAKVWLRFGPGEYKVILAHPINQWEREYDYNQTFYVRNVGTSDLRWQTPSQRVESDDPAIMALAQELTDGQAQTLAKARAIYGWVTRNISYNFTKGATADFRIDDGAARTLQTRKATPQETTELTVALLRAVGIQARLVEGSEMGAPFPGGSMWVEALADGRWVIMDPVFDAAVVVRGEVLVPATMEHFDPDPVEFAKEYRFEAYRNE